MNEGGKNRASGSSSSSYQARQGIQYQAGERPKFIQDFMQRTGMAPNKVEDSMNSRPTDVDVEWEDEMPVMVDSEGNMMEHVHLPVSGRTVSEPAPLKPVELDEDEQALAFLEESVREFEHEAMHPSEVTQQPASKRGRTAFRAAGGSLAVRERPKVSSVRDSRLLSFAMEDEEEE